MYGFALWSVDYIFHGLKISLLRYFRTRGSIHPVCTYMLLLDLQKDFFFKREKTNVLAMTFSAQVSPAAIKALTMKLFIFPKQQQ